MGRYNRDLLAHHELLATGTTGTLLEEALETPVDKLQSGPLGGDQQIGAKIAEGTVDFVIFFWDPLEPQPHDPGRQGAAAHRGGLEHPGRLQPGLRRLHDLVTAADLDLRTAAARVRSASESRRRR